MKKTYFTILFLTTILFCSAQSSILPSEPEYPVAGFAKLLNDNSYVLQQDTAANNTWNDVRKFTWIPSTVQSFRKESKTSETDNNGWTDVQFNNDSFVLDGQNRISIAFEDINYNYPNYTNRIVLKYFFTYGSNNKPSKIIIHQSPNFTQFTGYYEIHYSYNGTGQKTKDSTYIYQTQESYVNSYDYDGAGNIIKAYTFSSANDTIIGTTSYTYTNNKLHVAYGVGLNSSTNQWGDQVKDTFDYDAMGNIIHTSHYGYVSNNGQDFTFSPISDGFYHYNSQNQVDEIQERFWSPTSSNWWNQNKYTISYANNKPSLGYVYSSNAAGNGWSASPTGRLLFSAPAGVNNVPFNTKPEITVYPNPASKNMNVYIPFLNDKQEVTITLLNTNGENITVPVVLNQKEIALDIALLAKGVYMLKVQTNTTVVTKKVLITE